MTTIPTNLQAVRNRIVAACTNSGRPADAVQILAVSKTWPLASVLEAAGCGQRAFGENYVQEGVEKVAALAGLNPALSLEWHFIGPLQSNKTRLVAENFSWVQSVDRLKIAERLAVQRPLDLPPLQVCIQVNVSGEATKSGCAPAELPFLAQRVATLPGLCLRGLMAIPEPTEDVDLQLQRFHQVRLLFDGLKRNGLAVDTLSMGMSHDLEAAIQAGATMVRVGTAIFGARE